MGALTDLSALVNRLTGGNSGTPEHIWFYKNSRVNGAVATVISSKWFSLWEYEGQPSHGSPATSTGAALDNTTIGGLRQTDPGGGRQKWLLGFEAVTNQVGTIMLYDRLAHDGGFDATNTSSQSVSFTPPSRYNDGIGNQIWLEIVTTIGVTATTITVEYTNQAGTTGQITPAITFGGTNNREAQRMLPVPLASGDTGVQNITNVDLLATTGTVGDFSAVLIHPLASIPLAFAGNGMIRDMISGVPGLVEIKTDACLAMAWLATSSTSPDLIGAIHMVEA
jgi:hypothetical protein